MVAGESQSPTQSNRQAKPPHCCFSHSRPFYDSILSSLCIA
ncbi:hypothetical protein IG631_04870 [Alternaria alternata]|nr:hypothetical protein IG631_04870 [Alternaria alternata]